MNFKSDPSDFFHPNYSFSNERYHRGVYKELSKTTCYSSIFTAGLWRMFGNHTPLNESIKIFEELLNSGVNHFDLGNNYGRPPGSAEKQFGEADKIRDQIAGLGISLIDHKNNTLWMKKEPIKAEN